MTFDFGRILKLLEAGSTTPQGTWLADSWAAPGPFAAALVAFHAGRSTPPPKSKPGTLYDFYHDMVVRYAGDNHAAMRVFDPRDGGWQSISYGQLHQRAGKRAADWAAQGVKPGAKLCLFTHMGIELLVSLAAALRIGACISILPPASPRFVSLRLAALMPDHIASEPHQTPLFKGFEKLLLRDTGGGTRQVDSHTYAADEPFALLFSPLSNPPHVPVPLLADDAFMCALRDGLLTHLLRPEDHLFAPGFHLLQHQPALLLSALVRGATFIHIDLPVLEREPSLLTKYPIRSLGISTAVRDLILRTRTVPMKNIDHWFRHPEEPVDWVGWRNFIKTMDLLLVPNSNVLVDAAMGGAVLSSVRRRGEIHPELSPGAGRSFSLFDMTMTGQLTAGDTGVMQLLPADAKPPGYVIISRAHDEFIYGGTREPRREGRVFPSAEVVAVLAGLPFILGASVVPVPRGGIMNHHLFVLVIFTGSETTMVAEQAAEARRQEIRRRVEAQLGAEFMPDRIELFPLYPRRKEGIVDDNWCHSQYLSGALYRKSQDRMFQALTVLKTYTDAPKSEPARAG